MRSRAKKEGVKRPQPPGYYLISGEAAWELIRALLRALPKEMVLRVLWEECETDPVLKKRFDAMVDEILRRHKMR